MVYEIISCARDTQLHTFPGLDQLGSSPHVNNNGSDCHFFSTKLFLRANKNWGVEMMRIKDVDGKPTLACVKKISMDNLYCAACPKTDREEFAMGLTSGAIRLMNYKKSTYTKRFEADKIANGVTFLDFSATDDFLAAVYESGTVSLYGMKTSSRVATMSFDKQTTKVRFHPTKRFLLSVASYNGSVMLYDTQTKKIAFNQQDAHGAPCRDIAMTATNPDVIYSAGYDNVINIFDTRKKITASQIRSNYPFESLAISECGGYFCAGNLKGFIYGYDMRNLAEPINTCKVHDSIVNSLVFVPKPVEAREGNSRRVSFEPSRASLTAAEVVPVKTPVASPVPVQVKTEHDSFMGEIDQFLQRRDSMDYMSRLSTSSRLSSDSRSSINMGGGNNLMGYLDDLSDGNLDLDQLEAAQTSLEESNINVNRLLKRTTIKKQPAVDRTHRSTVNLENIREESDVDSSRALVEIPSDPNIESLKQTSNGTSKRISLRRSTDLENKENQHGTTMDKSSTPQPDANPTFNWDTPKAPQPATTVPTSDGPMSASVQAGFAELKLEIANLRSELREEMKEHFFQNKIDRKYTAQATRSNVWMGSFNLWQETQKKLERIDEVTQSGFGLLLTNDEFTQRFMALQKENEALKRRLAELEKRSTTMGGGGVGGRKSK
ncbi:uncharacterized protein LOC120431698 [Culex pipiens pallens]|uniref:uncharacterized protein LOC120431698 n=1 Tax=Culex pipiens pallens TaxID=42434 RepID=UPI0019533476|nr:uncharacterized protein LOC120431698 [Culex pipiens pallens]